LQLSLSNGFYYFIGFVIITFDKIEGHSFNNHVGITL